MRLERNVRADSVRRVRRALALWICVAWPLCGSGQTPQTQQKRPAMKPNDRVWVTSWATAPVSGTAVQAGLAAADAAGTSEPGGQSGSQSGSPAAAQSASLIGSQTLRQQVRVSLGGEEWRLELTNEFGTEPLVVDDVRLALSGDRSGSETSGAARAVTFHGAGRVSIPPGALMLSDPVAFTAAPLARLSVSLHLPAQTIRTVSWHFFTDQTNWIAAGDVTDEPVLKNAKSVVTWAFLKGLEVRAPAGAATVVAFGDSITEGVHSTRDRNRRWPDLLAERLAGQKVGMANEGIGGNRILGPAAGPGALARFDRDVLARAGLRFLIVLEGINDIGNMPPADTLEEAARSAKTEAMIGGLIQMIERAHRHGIKVYGATILPFEGAAYFTAGGEQVRQQVNAWIRTAGAFDGVVDLDRVTRDPAHPARLLPAYDPGDHLHPNDDGYKAMADSVDLRLFQLQ